MLTIFSRIITFAEFINLTLHPVIETELTKKIWTQKIYENYNVRGA